MKRATGLAESRGMAGSKRGYEALGALLVVVVLEEVVDVAC